MTQPFRIFLSISILYQKTKQTWKGGMVAIHRNGEIMVLIYKIREVTKELHLNL